MFWVGKITCGGSYVKTLKRGVSLVAVIGAVAAASLGGDFSSFTASNSEVSQTSTYFATKDGDLLVGTSGLHW
jgi:hypothetical protein